MLAHFESAL